MPSYELLELCEYMPDEGRYKTAWRGGNPPEHHRALFQAANELAVLRASYVQAVDSSEYDSKLFLLPSRLHELAEQSAEHAETQENIYSMATLSNTDSN